MSPAPRSHRARILIGTALMACAALATPRAAHATAVHSHVNLATTDARFGVVQAAAQPDVADAIGVRWSRIPFIWADIQASGPTSWNPFVLSRHGSDTVIDDELARG